MPILLKNKESEPDLVTTLRPWSVPSQVRPPTRYKIEVLLRHFTLYDMMPSLVEENSICLTLPVIFGGRGTLFMDAPIQLWGFRYSISLTEKKKALNTILKNALFLCGINILTCTAANMSDTNLRTAAQDLN